VVPLIGYNRHFATVEYGSEMQDYDDWGFDSIEVVEPIPQYGYLGIKSLPVGVNPANYYFVLFRVLMSGITALKYSR